MDYSTTFDASGRIKKLDITLRGQKFEFQTFYENIANCFLRHFYQCQCISKENKIYGNSGN